LMAVQVILDRPRVLEDGSRGIDQAYVSGTAAELTRVALWLRDNNLEPHGHLVGWLAKASRSGECWGTLPLAVAHNVIEASRVLGIPARGHAYLVPRGTEGAL
jgi:hypothetical protein